MKLLRPIGHHATPITVFSVAFSLASAGDAVSQRYVETVKANNAGDTVQFEMVLIPGGTFTMGSPEDETGRETDEGPQHQVKLAPFYLATTEVTLELFMVYYRETATARQDFPIPSSNPGVDAVTGPTPVYGDMTMGHGKKNPAMGMTWQNAAAFCRWLSRKTGKEYRLPTEAEWEYSCRGGTESVYGIADKSEEPAPYAWYFDNSGRRPHEVATRQPNAWGLFDMTGNVREWVSDFYAPDAYTGDAGRPMTVDPQGPAAGKLHVVRGGDHRSAVVALRCADRSVEEKSWKFGDPQMPKSKWWYPSVDQIGFRVARSAP